VKDRAAEPTLFCGGTRPESALGRLQVPKARPGRNLTQLSEPDRRRRPPGPGTSHAAARAPASDRSLVRQPLRTGCRLRLGARPRLHRHLPDRRSATITFGVNPYDGSRVMAAAGVVIWSGSAWADTAEQSREGPRGCRGLLEGWTGGGQGHGDLSARGAARNLAVGLWRWWVPPRSPAPTTLAFTATSSRCRSSQDTGRERAHLARSYQRLERLQGLLDGDRGVGRVQLVEVDHIGAEPTQAAWMRSGARPAPPRSETSKRTFVATTTSDR
jgi:hypothetical protein